ncbi:MAG: M14 family metallocarboxypeptidase [Oscillospiraceae bacterium]|nr:M14 family metallocarboxypeptidase [Oscillospiraceae bacterium]
MEFDYGVLSDAVEALAENCPASEIFTIGNSVEGREIYAIKTGSGPKRILVTAAHHSLEYITSAALMRFTMEYCGHIVSGEEMYGFSPALLSKKVILYSVPMVNPDGVELVLHGPDPDNPYHRKIMETTGIHNFSDIWQANINGVDLNHNYDAGWQQLASGPAPTRYGGPYPESEPETKALVNFVRNMNFDMLIALHSQGHEIYFDFDGLTAPRSEEIGALLAEASGYTLARPYGVSSFGGFKDWFIKEYGKEGFTVEIGLGKNPLPLSALGGEYESVAKLLLTAVANV